MNKNILPIMGIVISMLLVSYACKGKQGEHGERGEHGLAGVSVTTYSGTVGPETDVVNHVTAMDVSAPALTANSSIGFYLSSNTTNWENWGYSTFDLTAKTIHVDVGNIVVDHVGWTYKALVTNPD